MSEGQTTCRVHALSHPHGEPLWSSPPLEGACEGTPYYTSDGTKVFVNHNSAGGTVGHFTVLDENAGSPSIMYSFTQARPFGPFAFNRDNFPGGNYGAGAGNMNDLAIWGNKPSPAATSGEQGSTYAFQMPPPTAVTGPVVTTLLNITSWRHTAPPLLAARGQQLYWFVSRSKVRAWIQIRFSAGADAEADFDRGTLAFKAAPYTPVVNDELNPTIMCGGSAAEEFACLSTTNVSVVDNMMQVLWNITLGAGTVYGDPLMSTMGDRVYFADTAGVVRAADPASGAIAWQSETGVNIQANYELSSDGARFFFADTGGTIVAWEVGERTLPPVSLPPKGTPAPMATPTDISFSSQMPSSVEGPTDGTSPSPVSQGGGSIAPSIVMETFEPSIFMPILTAAPVLRPPTSRASLLRSSFFVAAFGLAVAILAFCC